MEKISNWIEKKISPLANKLARQKYLQALQNTFLALIPLFTIGSFALIIISPPMDYTTMDSGVLKAIMHGWANVAAFTGFGVCLLGNNVVNCALVINRVSN